ncbi:MAG TPA: alpha/beta hydrolase [Candidatus Sulfotelmatobacter sp.]|jgi:non-heme chloroperoxidase|nr:alpha/beta hydrolase [Candidatus Sulfotelmatobacter sp.]
MRTRLAVILLCLASVPSLTAQAAIPKSGFFRTSDGIRIHYLEAGSGRPIVFIPGWTMPAWIWQNQIDEFSKRYHVIAVDPRSQGESDKPPYGHLPETRSRDYKELVDELGLKRPVLVGWSMGCGELVKYVEQFGTDNVGGLVLVDGLLSDQPNPDFFVGISGWMNQLQQDRQKQADGFVRSMYKKPQPEDYLKRVVDASVQVPADTAVILIYNMIAVKDFSAGLAKINKPLLFTYQPETQQTADYLKSKLGDKVQLEKFEGDGHALFVDDPEKFNHVLEEFLKTLPK